MTDHSREEEQEEMEEMEDSIHITMTDEEVREEGEWSREVR